MVPRWIDRHTLQYHRQTPDGQKQRITVDARAGELSIESTVGGSPETRLLPVAGPNSQASSEPGDVTFDNQSATTVRLMWINQGGRPVPYSTIAPGQSHRQSTYAGHSWEIWDDEGELFFGSVVANQGDSRVEIKNPVPRPTQTAPDDRKPSRRDNWKSGVKSNATGSVARLRQGKLFFRASEPGSEWTQLDAAEDRNVAGDTSLTDPQWSPDGRVLVAWRVTRAAKNEFTVIESSPAGGGVAKVHRHTYTFPGDRMSRYELVGFDAEVGRSLPIDVPAIDFGRPRVRWQGNHTLLLEKVDRGHQRFRLLRINPLLASVQTLIDERSDTFLWTAHGPKMPLITYLDDSDEALYASERSGWRHLYRVDLTGHHPLQAITRGEWVVREIAKIDEATRTVFLVVGGFHASQDPYHRHFLRVSIDGGEPVPLSRAEGDCQATFSPEADYLIVTHSRVDRPPVHELRSAITGDPICKLASAEWNSDDQVPPNAPEVFVAKGRDGTTDIWGLICFPPDFDPQSSSSYPVLESIYAGPHDSHVPKSFRPGQWHRDLTASGFVVVQIDGMGTANRSKPFHDVCWQNLKDAGLPDRIAWLKSAARKYPALDLSRVGIFGTSAGGQNAVSALLCHGDFYRAAFAACGCHDNRMDKASWNEQWMGYPVGSAYEACSNVEHADQLRGDLMLLVGELDTNVPPESTLRLADALIRADKDFELIVMPGAGHTNGGSYGRRRMKDFFIRSLVSPSARGTPGRFPAGEID
ncbi:MAG: prolyl oligopeptidase family serine peptidase [Planctomycetota bacterium]